MREILQFLFIAFYVASSYVVSQERTALLVSELHHSASREGQPQIDTPCDHLDGGLPNYRHAKPKPLAAVAVGKNQAINLLPKTSERFIQIQTYSLKSLCVTESILSRAPPPQA